MVRKIYEKSIFKWLIGIGATGGTFLGWLFYYLILSGAITDYTYSGDSVCAGTEEDPCYAYINFTVADKPGTKEDIFLYPIGYDPWGRDTTFEFDPNVRSWKLQRSWGKGWRTIPLDKSCTGTWCGLSNSKDKRKFSVAFREGRSYKIRIVAYKHNPYEDIKWGAFDGLIDPVWLGADMIIKHDYKFKKIKQRGIENVLFYNITHLKNDSSLIVEADVNVTRYNFLKNTYQDWGTYTNAQKLQKCMVLESYVQETNPAFSCNNAAHRTQLLSRLQTFIQNGMDLFKNGVSKGFVEINKSHVTITIPNIKDKDLIRFGTGTIEYEYNVVDYIAYNDGDVGINTTLYKWTNQSYNDSINDLFITTQTNGYKFGGNDTTSNSTTLNEYKYIFESNKPIKKISEYEYYVPDKDKWRKISLKDICKKGVARLSNGTIAFIYNTRCRAVHNNNTLSVEFKSTNIIDPEIIIEITAAQHLNTTKGFISDIFNEVSVLDGNLSENISDGEYVRVKFESKLAYYNDITVYPTIVSGTPSIEVYEANTSNLVATFDSLSSGVKNFVVLTNLNGLQDNFDLKTVGGIIKYDHIVDPTSEHQLYLHTDGTNIVCGNTYLWDVANAPIGLGTMPDAVTCGTRTRIRDGDQSGVNVWGATFYNTTALAVDTTVTAISGHLHFQNTGTMWYELCEYTGTVYNCFGNSSSVTDTSGADFEEDVTFTSSGTVSAGNFVAIKVWFNEPTVATARIYTSSTDGFNSSVVLSYVTGAAGGNTTTWNTTNVNITVQGGSTDNVSAEVLVSGNLTNILVTELSGNGTGFMAPNATNIGSKNDSQNFTINFNCSPSNIQTPGYYTSLYNVNATEDVSGDNITVGCTVNNDAPTTPTNILCDGSTNCNISVDASVILNSTGSTDTEDNNIVYVLEALLQSIFTSSDLEAGTQSAQGEVGVGGGGGATQAVMAWEPTTGTNVATGITTDWTCGTDSTGGSTVTTVPSGSQTCAGERLANTLTNGQQIWGFDMWNNSNYTSQTLVTPDWAFFTMEERSSTTGLNFTFYVMYVIPDGTITFFPGVASVFLIADDVADYNFSLTGITPTIVPAGGKVGMRVNVTSTGSTDFRLNIGQGSSEAATDTGMFAVNNSPSGSAASNETNTSYVPYNETGTASSNINNISVKIEVDSYNPEASVNQSTNDPDLSLEIWNSTDWILIGNFTLPDTYTSTGLNTTNVNFTLTTTDATILSAWENNSHQNIQIRGKYMDYVNSSLIDEINWTNVWVSIDGKVYSVIGNHSETTTYTWDTSGLDEQTGIQLRSRAIDPNGSNSYSTYFFKFNFLNISHGVADTVAPIVTMINTSFSTTDTQPFIWFNTTDETASTQSCTLYNGTTGYGTNASVVNATDTSIQFNTALTAGTNYTDVHINCSDGTNTNVSDSIWVYIEPIPDNGTVTVTLLNNTDFNVSNGTFFTFSVNVSCATGGNNCSAGNVTLDPIETSSSYTPTTETHCDNNGKCWKTMYSGIMFGFEDAMWKDIKNMKSLKDTGITCSVKKKEVTDPDVVCLDYNYTSVKIRIDSAKNEILKVYDGKNNSKIKKEKAQKIKGEYIIGINDLYIFGDEIHIGANSTTIQLQDNETEILHHRLIYYNDDIYVTYIKINISAIPSEATIDDAKLGIYTDFIHAAGNPENITASRIDDNWNMVSPHETLCTKPSFNETNHTYAIPGSGSWTNLNFTYFVQEEFNNNNDTFSFKIFQMGLTSSCSVINLDTEDIRVGKFGTKGAIFQEKNENPASQRPYLNITYTVAGAPQSKSVIPEDAGTPFYVNSTVQNNPYQFSTISVGSSIIVNWSVMPNGTVDNIYKFFAYVNNTYNNVSSEIVNVTIIVPIADDSCTYSGSGDHTYACSDNCQISSTNFFQNTVTVDGAGTFKGIRNITNASTIRIQGGCTASA